MCNQIDYRVCGICKESKILNKENFHSDKSRFGGFMYNCKNCEKLRSKIKYEKNPRLGRYRLYTAEEKSKRLIIAKKYGRTKKGRAIYAFQSYRTIDRNKGLVFDLTKDFILEVLDKDCVYCGFPAIGLDRKDNKKGHTKENCVPSCKECNVGRMDNFTFEEMLELGKVIREIKLKRESKLSIAI